MGQEYQAGDVIVGVLAGIGVIVLIIVFIVVLRGNILR